MRRILRIPCVSLPIWSWFYLNKKKEEEKISQIKVEIEWGMNSFAHACVGARFSNNSSSTLKFSRESNREIHSKLVEKFVDKTRIWGTWDTLYMCVCIYLDIVTWCGLQCYFIDHHSIMVRRAVGSFSYRSTCSRDQRTRESPNASVSCGSCLLSRRGSTSLFDVHYVRL